MEENNLRRNHALSANAFKTLTQSLIHHFETVPNSMTLQMTSEKVAVKGF